MLKKLLIGGGTLATLAALIFGKDVVSYAHTAWCATRDAVKSEVPPEFEVERARTAVKQLMPAIQTTLKTIAQQQVEVEHLSREIARRSDDMQRQKEQMLTLKRDLGTGQASYRYASRTYSADEVKRDLRNRFDRFKTAESLLERDQRILESREVALRAHEHELDEMLSQKKELEAQVEQLDARLQTIRAEQAVSAPELDDSALSSAKQLIAEVNKQLDVQEKLLDAQGKFVGVIPVDTKPAVDLGNVTAEIDQYFNAKPAGHDAGDAPKPASVAKADGVKP
jgi:peptidoglycan hydrolase CwlO-like protein